MYKKLFYRVKNPFFILLFKLNKKGKLMQKEMIEELTEIRADIKPLLKKLNAILNYVNIKSLKALNADQKDKVLIFIKKNKLVSKSEITIKFKRTGSYRLYSEEGIVSTLLSEGSILEIKEKTGKKGREKTLYKPI